MDMASAFYDSCVLFAASDAGIFSYLDENPETDACDIAAGCGLDPHAARLLLDACVALGLLRKHAGQYTNSAEAEQYLVPDRPMDLSRAIRYNRDVYPAWGNLLQFARTGTPVERPALHLGEDAERTRAFVLAMHGRAMGIGRAVVPMLNLAGRQNLLDIGGGSGAYSMLSALAHPDLTCVVIDLPPVAAIADELIAEAGLTGRIRCLPGDYHTVAFPDGFDAVNILGVLHQEDPASIADILTRAWRAMQPGGILHILDMMTDETRTAPPFSALFAVNMALTTDHGWVFSDVDLAQWLEDAGFSDIDIRPLPAPIPHWLATARKPT